MVLHDFDLYPLQPDYFTAVVDRMRREELHFCGVELTHFDGLTEEDMILGTWGLGMDAQWIRNRYRPIDIFHKFHTIGGRWTNLDPFSYMQTLTKRRALMPDYADDSSPEVMKFCHVKNLCSTYLRYQKRHPIKVAWRLHYLWYLQSLIGDDTLARAVEAMRHAEGSVLDVNGMRVDFSDVDSTCASKLRKELVAMENSLHGSCRPEVEEFLRTFQEFLDRFGVPGSTVTSRA
jgi:hypothetical protein